MDELTPAARPLRYWLLAAVVTTLTAALRLHGLSELSLTVDESTIFVFARSILEHGYPVYFVGTQEIQLATYELYSYILALFIGIFGTSDFAIRLPSAVLATGTAYLIYSAGGKWFNLRTGVIAGLLYATAPWAIFWGQNGFHPQTHQFFAMLTLVQAAQILKAEPVPTRTYYLAALFFCCGFLSWEGLGFILPTLVIAALIVHWGDWRWLQNRHLWIACVIVIVVIVVQGTRRILLQENYLLVGSGRSEITGPELAFLEPYYLPYFYADQMFGGYTQLVVGIVFGLGLLFARRHWHFRFLATFVVAATLVMANMLSYYTLHYIYFALPAFLIAVAAATVIFVDWLGERSLWPAPRAHDWAGAIVLVALAGLELATAGVYGLKTWSITADAKSPPPTAYGTRLGIELVDNKGLAAALQALYVPGDPILSLHPFSVRQYTGVNENYLFMQSWTYQKVLFDPGGDRVRYIEKAAGGFAVRNQRELDDILDRNRRIWFVIPEELMTSMMDREMLLDFQLRVRLKANSYRGNIHLWSR